VEHLEGRQSVLSALRAYQRKFDVILVSANLHDDKVRDVLDAAATRDVPVRRVDWRELDAMTHAASHGGVVAVVSPKPRTSPDELLRSVDGLLAAGQPPLLLLLEGVDDARNLGFTLRTAEAMGVHAVLIKKHLWDFDAVEIARPASGAYERLPLVQLDDVAPLQQLQRRGLRLFGCITGAKRTMYDVDLARPAIVAIGGEKRGLSGAVRSICDRLITIPTRGGATSLSLSHAGAIVLAEAMRQRSAPRSGPDL
jgi:23S rRNA (guanosine2251-2'-O)-methyltransferase